MQFFYVLTWPPQPLDLNPIEDVWTLGKQNTNEYPTLAK